MRSHAAWAALITLVIFFSQGGAVHAALPPPAVRHVGYWRDSTSGNLGAYQSTAINYMNTVNGPVIGIVFGVCRNHAGRTVEISAGNETLPAGGMERPGWWTSVFLPARTPRHLFVVSPGGLALSATTEVPGTVAG